MKKVVLFFLLGLNCSCPGFGDRTLEEAPLDGGVPLVPNFEVDIAPLLELRCVSCHGQAPQNGAPAGLRLDLCESIDDERGASQLSSRILARIRDSPQAPMPPSGVGFGTNEILIFENWDDAGAPCSEGLP